MRPFLRVACLTVLLLVTSLAQAAKGADEDVLERAGALLRENRAVEAIELAKPLADRGIPLAQHYTAMALQFGPESVRDLGAAIRYWRLASNQGFAEAQFRLAAAYFTGTGVKQDEVTGLAWLMLARNGSGFFYELAVEEMSEGNIRRARELAAQLQTNIDVRKVQIIMEIKPQARTKALSDLAAGGNAEAQYQLALMYRSGVANGKPSRIMPFLEFVPGEPDLAEATRLFTLAAGLGHGGAQLEVGKALENSDPQKAAEFYEQASHKGEMEASLRLAGLLLDGHGIARNIPRAYALMRMVAKTGEPLWQAEVASAFARPSGDMREAYMWYAVAERSAREQFFEAFADDYASEQVRLSSLMSSGDVDEARGMAGRCWTSNFSNCGPPNPLERLLWLVGIR